MPPDLFHDATAPLPLGPGAVLLPGFMGERDVAILAALQTVVAAAPFRHMTTPGGFRMSVAMSNCGAAGWITDRRGYRYGASDPESGMPWPTMPNIFNALAGEAAALGGYDNFIPDACLINRYIPGARMTLHQDRNEVDFTAPIVSLSLGLPAKFLWGGAERNHRPRRLPLCHGDAVVWGGPSRLMFHGVDPLKTGEHPLTGMVRYNLTFRKAL